MKSPISYVYGNCIFARGLHDCWGAFAVELESYAWLDEESKRARFLALVGAVEGLHADLQILRVSGVDQLARGRDPRIEPGALGHGAELADYLQAQKQARQLEQASAPCLFFLVRLREPDTDIGTFLARAVSRRPAEVLQTLKRATLERTDRALAVSELERMRVRADRVHAHLSSYLPVRPARGTEVQWLVRRVFCRGLGEPSIDGLYEPPSLLFERNGEAKLAPLELDVLRWGSLVPFSTILVMISWFFSSP